jgi:hypothetical protein
MPFSPHEKYTADIALIAFQQVPIELRTQILSIFLGPEFRRVTSLTLKRTPAYVKRQADFVGNFLKDYIVLVDIHNHVLYP